MTTQAQPPTDAEQAQTLRTANALLRTRLAEQEQVVVEMRKAEERTRHIIDECRAVCDLLSVDSTTVAGQTLSEAVRALIRERDEAHALASRWQQRARTLAQTWAAEKAVYLRRIEEQNRQAEQWKRVVNAQRDMLTALSRIIGTETPIAAFTLAETWQAEKAHYMERIEALTHACDALGQGQTEE